MSKTKKSTKVKPSNTFNNCEFAGVKFDGQALACLKDIRNEFQRLHDKAETIRDKLYLCGVLAVIDTKSKAAIAAAEEGIGNERRGKEK